MDERVQRGGEGDDHAERFPPSVAEPLNQRLVTAEPELTVEFVTVDYDHETVAREMAREGLPAEFVETIRTGWWTCCLGSMPVKERARGRS